MSDYKKFAFTPKGMTGGDSLGQGEVDFVHLSPALFAAIRNIQLHTHSGIGSTKVKIQDLDGYFPKTGFLIYSSTGSGKKFVVTINDSGVLQSQEI